MTGGRAEARLCRGTCLGRPGKPYGAAMSGARAREGLFVRSLFMWVCGISLCLTLNAVTVEVDGAEEGGILPVLTLCAVTSL